MSTVSIAIICQDNQDLIIDCLESAKWADEIIVFDAGSKDQTLEIARRYTSKIYQHAVERHLNEQWNRAINYATSEWVFILSTDQRISPQLRDEIKQIIQQKEAKTGYFAPMENYFLGQWIRHCGWYPDYNVTLFKRGRAVYSDKEGGLLQVDGECGHLKNRVVHYSHRDLTHTIGKINMISTRDAEHFMIERPTFKERFVLTKALRNFKKTYWKQKGYKDGMHGLAFCITFSFYKLLIYSKYWQFLQREKRQDSGN
ncbi:glycosyltransferase family 2 protein [Candidatus Omnitrophota bacterium]